MLWVSEQDSGCSECTLSSNTIWQNIEKIFWTKNRAVASICFVLLKQV